MVFFKAMVFPLFPGGNELSYEMKYPRNVLLHRTEK